VAGETLRDARARRAADVVTRMVDKTIPSQPSDERFALIHYPAPLGSNLAYIARPPAAKSPALVWVHGSIYGRLDDVPDIRAFGDAAIVLMFPGTRGWNGNPGYHEGFYGEVDDVLAAADYLATQDFVDPQRIYLGGHSTGGTLALLTAESSPRFRAVFALGPSSNVRRYDAGHRPPIAWWDQRGFDLRSPINWLASIGSPAFVFEGENRPSNAGDVRELAQASHNPFAHFYLVTGEDHASALAPVVTMIAAAIAGDTGPRSNVTFKGPALSVVEH
jgi:acetyl esterase/lipase